MHTSLCIYIFIYFLCTYIIVINIVYVYYASTFGTRAVWNQNRSIDRLVLKFKIKLKDRPVLRQHCFDDLNLSSGIERGQGFDAVIDVSVLYCLLIPFRRSLLSDSIRKPPKNSTCCTFTKETLFLIKNSTGILIFRSIFYSDFNISGI